MLLRLTFAAAAVTWFCASELPKLQEALAGIRAAAALLPG